MFVTINGKKVELPVNVTLKETVEKFSTRPECVIAELNGNIQKHNGWSSTTLQDGDSLELISFVGGG